MHIHIRWVALFSASLAPLQSVHADDALPSHNPALRDSFYFALGGYVPKTSTSAQLDSTNLGIGTNIDFERALGMTTQRVVPDVSARWRFAEHWRFEVAYFELNRSGDKVIEQDIHWGDQDFVAGTQIQSKFNFSDLRTSIGYSFFKRPDKDIGVALGAHIASYDVGLSVAGIGVVPAGGGSESKKVLAPLPVLSVYGQFALTDEWAISMRLDRFVMSYDHYYGNITSSAIDVNYQPFRYVGFGLGYRSLFINLSATKPDWTATFSQSFQGPLAYMNANF
jgi:hypothetical protein